MSKSLLVALALAFAGGVAWADEVKLSSGEVLKVTNVTTSGGRVRMDHPVLGHLDLAAEQVTEIVREGGAKVTGAGVPVPPPAVPPPKWKFKAELGVTGEHGTTRTQDLRAAIGALLETPSERWKLDSAFRRSKAEGDVTSENWYVQGLHDWIFRDSPWSLFATARYDRDLFQPWDSRYSLGGGVGYALFDTDTLKTRLRAGFQETRENGGPNDGHWRPEGLLGAEAMYKLTASQTLEGSVTWYPDLLDNGEYRIVSTAAWSVKLTDNGLSFKAGIEDEYDSHREAPFERNDLKYFLALLYEF